MKTGIFDDAALVGTVLRVRDVAASVRWYRERLGLEPVPVGTDGPEHPIATFAIAGSVVSLWQLPAGQSRNREDIDRNSHVVVVMNQDPETVRWWLAERRVEVGEIRRSAHNEFVRFLDPDSNRFELSRPLTAEPSAAPR